MSVSGKNLDLNSFRIQQQKRKKRFRILVCINGSEESFQGVEYASDIARNGLCDIILLYVRPVDQGLRTGGLQLRLARQNMLDWGLELPGIQFLKRGLEILSENGITIPKNDLLVSHSDVWGDPLGDNKTEYKGVDGDSIVLKLKTAPDVATGILDQCELGPYNLLILGEPSHWRSGWNTFWGAGVVQKVAMVAPCSVLITRKHDSKMKKKGHLIYTDGGSDSLKYLIQDAVLAQHCKQKITIIASTERAADVKVLEKRVLQTKNKLKKMGIKAKVLPTCVGEAATCIINHSKGFHIVSLSDNQRGGLINFFTKNTAMEVMAHSKTSVLNAR